MTPRRMSATKRRAISRVAATALLVPWTAGCGEYARIQYSEPNGLKLYKLRSPEPPVNGWVIGEAHTPEYRLFVATNNSRTLRRTPLLFLIPIGYKRAEPPTARRLAVSLAFEPKSGALRLDPSKPTLELGADRHRPTAFRATTKNLHLVRGSESSLSCMVPDDVALDALAPVEFRQLGCVVLRFEVLAPDPTQTFDLEVDGLSLAGHPLEPLRLRFREKTMGGVAFVPLQ